VTGSQTNVESGARLASLNGKLLRSTTNSVVRSLSPAEHGAAVIDAPEISGPTISWAIQHSKTGKQHLCRG
jgi:hypothetical protein